MMIELITNGKTVKNWWAQYRFGPFPMDEEMIQQKELQLENKILECKVDAGPLIYNNPYEMFATVKSRMDPNDISKEEWNDFLLQVAKNKTINNKEKHDTSQQDHRRGKKIFQTKSFK